MERTLHLIDIENLAGDGLDRHGIAIDRLRRHIGRTWKAGDQVVVAANRRLCSRLAWDIPVPHRLKVGRSGPNGSDLELLESAANVDVSAFSGLAIASGDGIFAELARTAASSGAYVTVSCNRGSLSRELARTAHRKVMLPRVPASC